MRVVGKMGVSEAGGRLGWVREIGMRQDGRMDVLVKLASVTGPFKTVRCRMPALLFFITTEHEHILQGFSFAETEVLERCVLLLPPSMYSTVVELLTFELASGLLNVARNLHMLCP